jgi:hypothetical protein
VSEMGVSHQLTISKERILPGRATGIRTPDLLHAIHARAVGSHRHASPGGKLACGDGRLAPPVIAWLMCMLAPILAPGEARSRRPLELNSPERLYHA